MNESEIGSSLHGYALLNLNTLTQLQHQLYHQPTKLLTRYMLIIFFNLNFNFSAQGMIFFFSSD